MAARERWYFTKEELENSPSRRCGIDAEKELSYRQQAANLIQDMGQKLKVNQLVINTAIVYMHRFYTFHSFTKFHRNAISSCALFLAAKVEEQHRKLEHVIKISQMCLCRDISDIRSEQFQVLASELVYHENLMLRTLGFDLSVQHPHSSVVSCFDLVRAPKDLAQASYIMATNTLHLTTMCLQYKPTVVACICVYFVCKWACFELAKSSEGRDWWTYVDANVTQDMLEELTNEFLSILKKCPSRLKKILSTNHLKQTMIPNSPSLKPTEDKKSLVENKYDPRKPHSQKSDSSSKNSPKDKPLPNNRISKSLFNPSNDPSAKKDSDHDSFAMTKSNVAPKQSASHQINSSATSSLQSGEINSSKSHSNFNPSISSTRNIALADDKNSKSKELNSHSSISNSNNNEKIKPSLSVINSNNNRPNSNNSCNANNSFNDSLFNDSQMFSDSSEYSDYSAAKKDIPDLKMEFSENEDSNASEYNLGLGHLGSTFIMNDSNDSKSMSTSFAEFSQQFSKNHSNKTANNTLINNEIKNSQNSLPLFNEFSSNSNHMSDILKNDSESSSDKSSMSSLTVNKQRFPLSKNSDSNKVGMDSVDNSSTNKSKAFDITGVSGDYSSSSSKQLPPVGPPPPSLPTLPINNTILPPLPSSILSDIKQHPPATASALIQLINDTYHSSSNPPTMTNNVVDETSNHSRSSFKHHKEKHKHKDKHKHKEKHKHKHKSKDKQHTSSSSFTLVEPENESEKPRIKLKIRKNDLSTDSTDAIDKTTVGKNASSDTPTSSGPGLKLKINLKNKNILQTSTENTTSTSSSSSTATSSSSNKKRKH